MEINAPEDIPTAIGLDLLRWAGLADEEGQITGDMDDVERFADAIQNSSIPEACRDVAAPPEPTDDQLYNRAGVEGGIPYRL